MPSFKILQAEVQGLYVLKFIGEIRLNLCSTLDKIIEGMVSNPDFKTVVVDLTETSIVDSTTLGLLAKIAVAAKDRSNFMPTLLTTNPDVTKIVESMGFDRIFFILTESASDIQTLQEIPVSGASEAEAKEQVLEAHRVLMKMNKRNWDEFKDLVKALEGEAEI